MRLMLCYIRKHLGMFLVAVVFLAIETFADLLQPTFMSYIVDRGVKGADVGLIWRYGLIMLGITAMGAVGAVVRNTYASRTSQLIGKEIRLAIYEKVQALSYENIDRLQPASIITRITNDVTQMQNFINGIMRIMLKAPVTCVGAVALIIFQMPRLLPLMLVILVCAGLLIYGNMKLGYPRFDRMQRKLDGLNHTSREFLSAIRVVKAFRAEEQEQEKFQEASLQLAEAGISSMRVMAVFGPLINLTVNGGIVVMLWLSGREMAGEIGQLMACVNYMTQVLFALGMVSNILNSAVRAVASSARVQEILDETPAQAEVSARKELSSRAEAPFSDDGKRREPGGSVSIAFRQVSFAYAGTSRPAVQEADFTVREGETVGIIGPTGSGKTTLVNLVPRFYDATRGQVLVEGRDVTLTPTEQLRGYIAVVPQKALLFSGTILENLRWGDKEATPEEVRRAAEAACAEEFVSKLPEGYDTLLGQGGVNLSGGQKQRLSIARALLKKPRVLILDDCTSALDATTEARVLAGIRRESAGMTVLLVSQRIATVMKADHILCMEDGRVCGFGSHQDLMTDCEPYRAIYNSQIGE
ncbi:putative ABC transporter ATP-binding protein [Lachnospiraceae bacterium]|nr:ABC transporter ATP-binding protein [Lachnospiraceae bacterium]MCX4271416.1 ABC transporter ATP-binding protein [Acetatifactor sp.]GFH94055.1 putative ABC transporter ATP-binding protein [Lachnospiraceae bacterium]